MKGAHAVEAEAGAPTSPAPIHRAMMGNIRLTGGSFDRANLTEAISAQLLNDASS